MPRLPRVGGKDCSHCLVGVASDVASGKPCALIHQTHGAGLIYVQGEPADFVWFVKNGLVTLHSETGQRHGEGRAHALRFPGHFIGLEALVSPQYRNSARATTEVELCGTSRDGFDAWLGPSGTPARIALESMLRAAAGDVTLRAAPDGSAVQRVAAWLWEEGPRGVTVDMPRQIVADLLGMRPETLSRALATLTERGAILARRDSLAILDERMLADIADEAILTTRDSSD